MRRRVTGPTRRPRHRAYATARPGSTPVVGSVVFYEFLISAVEKAILRQTHGPRPARPHMVLRGLGAQEPAEMRHRERDQAPLGAVDEPFLDQPVAGR